MPNENNLRKKTSIMTVKMKKKRTSRKIKAKKISLIKWPKE